MTDLQNEKTYDSVFWTGIVKLTGYLVPLVNEAFGEHFSDSTRVTLKPMKQVTHQQDGSALRGETDALAELSDPSGATKDYHFEVETWPSGHIAVRLAEYGAASAYASAERTQDGAVMRVPNSAVVVLRSAKQSRRGYKITIEYPGGSVSYNAPVVRLMDYSLDDLLDRRLLLLLPFFPLRFADRLDEMERDDGWVAEFKGALDKVEASTPFHKS